MKSLKTILLFSALSLAFMGCPYESKVPVDSLSAAKSDKFFATDWDEKGEASYLWKITLSDKQYSIAKKNIKEGGEPTLYTGFLSDIDGQTFLNVYENSSDGTEKKYYIYRVEKRGEERFKLQAMTDNVTEEFATSGELKAFIKKNMGSSFFWNKDDEKSFFKH